MKHIQTEITFVNFPKIEEQFIEKLKQFNTTFCLHHMSGTTKMLINGKYTKKDFDGFSDHIIYIHYDIWYDSIKVNNNHIEEVDAILDTMSHRLSGLIDE